MRKRNKSIFRITLTGMLAVLCIVLMPMFGYLFTINLPERLNRNAIELLEKQTENRQTYLEDKLLKNHNLTELSAKIDVAAQELIDAGKLDLAELNLENTGYVTLLETISEDLISTLRGKDVTGIFVVLNTTDMELLEDGTELPGIYIRDLDPDATPSERNSDLLLERSPIQLVKSLRISTDKAWNTVVRSGSQVSNNFIYPTFQAAYKDHAQLDESDYGHLTTSTYRLIDDTHPAMAYSIPLILPSGEVYGVVGVEMLESYIESMIPAQELENDGEGIYFLAHAKASNIGEDIPIHVAVASPSEYTIENEILTLNVDEKQDGWITIDEETYYASVKPLSLYNRNTPFSEEQWFLVGAVPEKQLFSFSLEIYTYLWILFLLCAVLGVFCCVVISKRIARPIHQMYMDLQEAQKHPDRIPQFAPTNMKELERFSSAITNLSQDIVDNSTKFLRIIKMASMELAGYEIRYDTKTVYVTDNFFELLEIAESDVEELTMESFYELLAEIDRQYAHSDSASGGKVYRVVKKNGEIHYLHMKKAFFEYSQVGVIEDETESILDKIQISHDRDFDSLTNIYNRRAVQTKYKAIFQTPERIKCAAVIMMDLDNLKDVNDTYGHDYGDKYIQQAARCLDESLVGNVVYGRISGDEFFVFLYGYDSKEQVRSSIKYLTDTIQNRYIELPDGTKKGISMSGGIAWYGEPATHSDELKKYADMAMYQMKKTGKGKFGEYQSQE